MRNNLIIRLGILGIINLALLSGCTTDTECQACLDWQRQVAFECSSAKQYRAEQETATKAAPAHYVVCDGENPCKKPTYIHQAKPVSKKTKTTKSKHKSKKYYPLPVSVTKGEKRDAKTKNTMVQPVPPKDSNTNAPIRTDMPNGDQCTCSS